MGPVIRTSILALGHSHLSALKRAYQEACAEGSKPTPVSWTFMQLRRAVFQPNLLADGGDLKLNDFMVQQFQREIESSDPQGIVSCMLGNEYNFLAMLNHRRRFDFYLPARLDLPTDKSAEILPVALVEDLIRSRLENSLGVLLTQLALLSGNRPMVHVPPPPPVRQTDHIEKYPGVFSERVKRLGVSPPFFRLKMWLLTCEVQRKICEKAGVALHRLPQSVFDADGFLAEVFLNQDPTHGNSQYGRVLLDDFVGKTFHCLVTEKTSERAPLQEFAGLSSLAARS